jgi:hypothetical protein
MRCVSFFSTLPNEPCVCLISTLPKEPCLSQFYATERALRVSVLRYRTSPASVLSLRYQKSPACLSSTLPKEPCVSQFYATKRALRVSVLRYRKSPACHSSTLPNEPFMSQLYATERALHLSYLYATERALHLSQPPISKSTITSWHSSSVLERSLVLFPIRRRAVTCGWGFHCFSSVSRSRLRCFGSIANRCTSMSFRARFQIHYWCNHPNTGHRIISTTGKSLTNEEQIIARRWSRMESRGKDRAQF